MLLSLATVLILATGPQSQPDVRVRAEQLARAGRTVEALELFRQVVAQNPGDIEARLWVARLDLRMGTLTTRKRHVARSYVNIRETWTRRSASAMP